MVQGPLTGSLVEMQEWTVSEPPQIRMEPPMKWLGWESLESGRSMVKVLNPRMSSNSVVIFVSTPPEMKMTSLAGAEVVVVVTVEVVVVVVS